MAFPVWPANVRPSVCDIRLTTNTKVFESSFNRAAQRVSYGGELWEGSLQFANLPRDLAQELIGFLWGLDALGPFWLGDFAFQQPRGPALGTPVVNGAGQTGRLLSVRGCQPSTLFLRAGDYLQVGEALLGCRADVTADAAGVCNIPVVPRLRTIPADGAPVIVRNTQGLFCLVDDNQLPRRSTSRSAVVTSFEIGVIEYL